uniref:acetylserotonin O-methyltransferase n=1 Tax=Oryza nivara TaxID=4536 RepID=A0A0E0HGX1_ORYNI
MELTESKCDGGQEVSLLDAQLELYWNTFAVIKSMALKSALDLGIADAVHRHGDAATLAEIASEVALHPSKIPCLRRLMRALTVSGVFAVAVKPGDGGGGEPVYELTPSSRLLVGSSNLSGIMSMILHPTLVVPFLGVGEWLRRDREPPEEDPYCIFKQAHGRSLWELAGRDAAFDALVNDGMVSDSRVIMDYVVREHGEVFRGIASLVDLAGGLGAAAQVISKAFPEVRCSVMDLVHVVAKAPAGTDVEYIAGDMFESVPPADAVFLKWVLHDWSDDDCIKILKNCKKAIPPRDKGGKVIIMDIVVAGPSDQKHREVQALFDMYIMFVNGIERDEQEWKKVFMGVGFNACSSIITDLILETTMQNLKSRI